MIASARSLVDPHRRFDWVRLDLIEIKRRYQRRPTRGRARVGFSSDQPSDSKGRRDEVSDDVYPNVVALRVAVAVPDEFRGPLVEWHTIDRLAVEQGRL